MATKKSVESNKVEVRISVTESSRELSLESSATREEIIEKVNKAIAANLPLVLEDFRGKQVIIPASKIGFIEIAPPVERKVGFAKP